MLDIKKNPVLMPKLLYESSGLGAVTSASDTHPGYRIV